MAANAGLSSATGTTILPDWTRPAALGGVVFFILLVVAFIAPGAAPPNVDASHADLVSYYVKHHTGVMIADFCNALGTVLYLGFVAALWRVIRRVDGSGVVAALIVALGAAGVAIALAGFAADMGVTFQAAKMNDAGVLRALFDVNRVCLLLVWFPLGVLIALASAVTVITNVLPRWLGWAGIVAAVIMLISTLGIFADKQNFIANLGFIGFILFALWTLAASIVLYLRLPSITAIDG